MKNGIYALASLDGRPLAARDLTALGLVAEKRATQTAPGCVMLPQDVRASAIHSRSGAHGIDVLLGDLDEPDDVARMLGLPASTDQLTLALLTMERFGDRAPASLFGTWVLVRWDAPSATLTLLMAERVRDTCYVATDGVRVALSPELVRLARLDWVDAVPDPVNLLLCTGRGTLRHARGDRTMLRDVVQVMPGTRVTIRLGKRQTSIAEAPTLPATPTAASFDEAIEGLDHILRRIARQHFEREGDSALSLSGGLDPSLLALYSAQERGSRNLTFLTSAAPPGSSLADETAFASIVAAHLGVPIEKVAPAADADVYQPSDRLMAMVEGPSFSPRHYLDEALEQAALDQNVSALLNGYGGEMTVTHDGAAFAKPQPLRDTVRKIRARFRRAGDRGDWPADGFHVRLSHAAMDRARSAIPDPRDAFAQLPRSSDVLGYGIGIVKAAAQPSWGVTPALRTPSLFNDRRLVRYAAGLPGAFTHHCGQDRALARYLLNKKLPSSIVFRSKGMAYSPSYYEMILDQAASARRQIPLFRVEELGEWIDLEWLDTNLMQIQQKTPLSTDRAFMVEATMLFCEFLLWWRCRT